MISHKLGRQRGVALIEFALVLPLLLTLLIGTIYYGYVFMLQSAATHAAQAGAAAAVAVSPLGKPVSGPGSYEEVVKATVAATVAQSLNWLPSSINDGITSGSVVCEGTATGFCTQITGSLLEVTVQLNVTGGSSPLLPQISLPGIGPIPPVPERGILTGSAEVTL